MYNTITELEHIEKWSTANNLRLNHTKTLEILFVARGIRGSCAVLPPPLPGIARVDSIKALEVVVNNRLTAADHVDSTIAACVKSLYALKVLRSHGMPPLALHTVFQAIVLSKLTYCSCAWYGFCTAKERDRLESFLRRCKHRGYCADNTPTFEELCAASDAQLFQHVIAAHTSFSPTS